MTAEEANKIADDLMATVESHDDPIDQMIQLVYSARHEVRLSSNPQVVASLLKKNSKKFRVLLDLVYMTTPEELRLRSEAWPQQAKIYFEKQDRVPTFSEYRTWVKNYALRKERE